MINVIKANFYKLSKGKFLKVYTILMFLLLFFLFGLFFFIKIIGGELTLIKGNEVICGSLSSVGFISIIFGILLISTISEEFDEKILKNIFSRGISKRNYIGGNIITMMILSFVSQLIYTASTVIIIIYNNYKIEGYVATIFVKVGLSVLIIGAIISVAILSILWIKKGVKALVVFLLILYTPNILQFLNVWFKLDFDFSRLSLLANANLLSISSISMNDILQIFIVSFITIVLFFNLANRCLNQQEIK